MDAILNAVFTFCKSTYSPAETRMEGKTSNSGTTRYRLKRQSIFKTSIKMDKSVIKIMVHYYSPQFKPWAVERYPATATVSKI